MADTENLSQNISTSERSSQMDNTPEMPESPRPMTPAFILTEDTGPVNGYFLGKKIAEIIGMSNTISVQETKTLWIIYIKSNEAKVKLTAQGISLDGMYVRVYGTNPFMLRTLSEYTSASNMTNTPEDNREWIRILIKDLRHSVSMEDVRHMLVNVYKIQVTTDIKYAHYRDENKKLTSLLNGDRFLWVHPEQLTHPLPRFAQCGIWKCRIFHKDQFPTQTECYNCYSLDHIAKDCHFESCCRVCKEPGHSPGNPDCPHYILHADLRVFGGSEDPLSNHYEKVFTYNHVDALTSENHWFNQKGLKNGQEELANMCLNAESGREAKYLAHGINCTNDWDQGTLGYSIMKDIVRCKLNQVVEAREELFLAWYNNEIIVEGVHTFKDTYWGSGLSKQATKHTKQEYWPGNNKLGQIYMELADELFGANQWAEKTPDNPYGKNDLTQKAPESSKPPLPTLPANPTVTPSLSANVVDSDSTSVELNTEDPMSLSQSENENVPIVNESTEKPPEMPKDMLLSSHVQVQKTREQIGSLIAGIRSTTPSSTPKNSPTSTPTSSPQKRRVSKSPTKRSNTPSSVSIATKLRQIANSGGHISRSHTKPAKGTDQPRSSSIKRSISSPAEEKVSKFHKKNDVEESKINNDQKEPG